MGKSKIDSVINLLEEYQKEEKEEFEVISKISFAIGVCMHDKSVTKNDLIEIIRKVILNRQDKKVEG